MAGGLNKHAWIPKQTERETYNLLAQVPAVLSKNKTKRKTKRAEF